MSAIVRGNKASRLRAGQLPAKIVKPGVWASGPIQSGSFGPAQSNPNPAPPRSVSRLPVRIPGVRTSRNTSPNHSIGPIDRAISSCSLPQRLGLGSTVGDHKSNNATEEKEETKPVVPQPRTNTPAPQRGREKIGASNPKISNIQPPRSVSCQSAGAGENKSKLFTAQRSHHQVLELTRMRTIEAQHKKLEHMQSEFLDKLRTAGPLAKKLTGVYKFVTMVVNDECKVVMHEDDLLRLPKNLPTESVNDLKNRCRTVVELGLMAVYDFMPQIQLAKSDREARDKREELRCKLKALVNRRMVPIVEEIEQLCGPMGNRPEACNQSLYREIADIRTQKQHMETRYFDLKKELCDTVNQQRAEFEAKQTSELALRDHTINELKKALKRSEEMVQQQTVQLAEKSESLKTEDVTSEKLRSELDQLKSVNTRINLQLEEAIAGLERANCSVKKQEGKIIYLEGELKEAREFIVSLQKRPDTLDKGVVEKDLIIADLKLQLQNIEHSKNMLQKQVKTALKQHGEFEELDGKHQSALSQINDLKQMLKSSAGEKENQAKTEEKLRKELAKMREQIDQDQHMLTMRGDLINSLQETEKDTRTKLDKMYYQVSEKDTLINQVNNELASKDEEFRNLFGTLTFKQKEVRRQEHIIKLLEENNMRNSMLRARQDERNANMQVEIANLKRTIQNYAKILIGNNGQTFFEVVPADEVNTTTTCCQGEAGGNAIEDSQKEFPISTDIVCEFAPRLLALQQQQQQQQSVQQLPEMSQPPHGGKYFEPLQHHLSRQQQQQSQHGSTHHPPDNPQHPLRPPQHLPESPLQLLQQHRRR